MALLMATGLVGPAGPASAGPDGAAALSPTPKYIVKSPAGKLDNLFETVATSKGFLVTFARSVGSTPPFTLFTQRFTAAGKPIGKPVPFDSGIVGDHVELARTGPRGAVAVWQAPNNGQQGLKAGIVDLETGKVSKIRPIGVSNDHIHDVARLSNGNIAVVTPQVTPLPLPGRYTIKVKILSPSLGTVKEWTSVHGAGFPLDPWAYYDQTVVAKRSGGLVLYRDHATNRIMGRNVTNGGGLGSAVTLNTTPMGSFTVTDIAYLEVKGALLSDGRIAACWVHLRAEAARYDVRCRILSPAGSPIGSDFAVHASPAGNQTAPEIEPLPGGRFTVTWVQADSIFPSAVKYRTFKSTGAPQFAEKIASALTELASAPFQTESARLPDGSIVNVMGPTVFVPGIRAAGIANPLTP